MAITTGNLAATHSYSTPSFFAQHASTIINVHLHQQHHHLHQHAAPSSHSSFSPTLHAFIIFSNLLHHHYLSSIIIIINRTTAPAMAASPPPITATFSLSPHGKQPPSPCSSLSPCSHRHHLSTHARVAAPREEEGEGAMEERRKRSRKREREKGRWSGRQKEGDGVWENDGGIVFGL